MQVIGEYKCSVSHVSALRQLAPAHLKLILILS